MIRSICPLSSCFRLKPPSNTDDFDGKSVVSEGQTKIPTQPITRPQRNAAQFCCVGCTHCSPPQEQLKVLSELEEIRAELGSVSK